MTDHEQQLEKDLCSALQPIQNMFGKFIRMEFITPITVREEHTDEKYWHKEPILSTCIYVNSADVKPFMLINFIFEPGKLQTTSKLEHRLIYHLKLVLNDLIDKYDDEFEIILEVIECKQCINKEHDWYAPMTENISTYYETSEENPNNLAAKLLTEIKNACGETND